MIVATWVLGLSLVPTSPEPAAFTVLKQMVGGVWRGTVGDKLPVEQRFSLVEGGKVIEGFGVVGDPKKPVLKMHSRMGLDAKGGVYYLDMHNSDTVYFGSVTEVNGAGVFDFTDVTAHAGHWISRARINGDSCESMLSTVDASGAEKTLHGLKLTRMKK